MYLNIPPITITSRKPFIMSLLALPLLVLDLIIKRPELRLPDLHSLRYVNKSLHVAVTIYLLQQIVHSVRVRADTLTLVHVNRDRDTHLGTLTVRNGLGWLETNVVYDESDWEKVILTVQIKDVDISWTCPEICTGPMAQLVAHKCRVVGGFKNTRKRVRMSMYLDFSHALKPDLDRTSATSNKGLPPPKPRKQKKKSPPKSSTLLKKWIYVYLLYDRLEKRGRVVKKLVSVEINIHNLLPFTIVYTWLLFKANEQHADIPITAPRTMRLLMFADRPYEFAGIIKKNREFFTAMHAILPSAKYHQLGNLWKMPRELIDDEDWVKETKSVIMSGIGEDAGHLFWVTWRDLIGWESDSESDSNGEEMDSNRYETDSNEDEIS